MMKNWTLRPEIKIRNVICKQKKVIIKGISENYLKTTKDIIKEFKDYDLRFVLIYRDVVNVYYSNILHDPNYESIEMFIEEYNSRMKKTLYGLDFKKTDVIKYEDILGSEELFLKICNKSGVKG